MYTNCAKMENLKDIILKKINKGSINELKEFREFFTLESPKIIEEINKKIDNLEFKSKKCVVCGRDIEDVDEPFVLYFGKKGFRKRAFFCGIDCLSYFLNQYRELKEKRKTNENQKEKIYF